MRDSKPPGGLICRNTAKKPYEIKILIHIANISQEQLGFLTPRGACGICNLVCIIIMDQIKIYQIKSNAYGEMIS